MNLKDKGISNNYIEKNITLKVIEEHLRQIKKWGYQNHNIYKWLCIIHEEIGELDKAILEHEVSYINNGYLRPLTEIKNEIIQIITLHIKLYKMLDELQ